MDLRRGEALDLLHDLELATGDELGPGLPPDGVESLAERVRLPVPGELTEWLGVCNGVELDGGWLLGVRPSAGELDIESVFRRHPGWHGAAWLPVAVDREGRHFVVSCSGGARLGAPVLCVDPAIDAYTTAWVAASRVWSFVCFFVARELGEERWPLDSRHVLSVDPGLTDYPEQLLPWTYVDPWRRGGVS